MNSSLCADEEEHPVQDNHSNQSSTRRREAITGIWDYGNACPVPD